MSGATMAAHQCCCGDRGEPEPEDQLGTCGDIPLNPVSPFDRCYDGPTSAVLEFRDFGYRFWVDRLGPNSYGEVSQVTFGVMMTKQAGCLWESVPTSGCHNGDLIGVAGQFDHVSPDFPQCEIVAAGVTTFNDILSHFEVTCYDWRGLAWWRLDFLEGGSCDPDRVLDNALTFSADLPPEPSLGCYDSPVPAYQRTEVCALSPVYQATYYPKSGDEFVLYSIDPGTGAPIAPIKGDPSHLTTGTIVWT